jgi:hypothetical protein
MFRRKDKNEEAEIKKIAYFNTVSGISFGENAL